MQQEGVIMERRRLRAKLFVDVACGGRKRNAIKKFPGFVIIYKANPQIIREEFFVYDVCNEKDSPTFDLTVRPLSGAITASPLLNSNDGAKVKTSGNSGDFPLFNCLSAH
jgi:hypothetical protein